MSKKLLPINTTTYSWVNIAFTISMERWLSKVCCKSWIWEPSSCVQKFRFFLFLLSFHSSLCRRQDILNFFRLLFLLILLNLNFLLLITLCILILLSLIRNVNNIDVQIFILKILIHIAITLFICIFLLRYLMLLIKVDISVFTLGYPSICTVIFSWVIPRKSLGNLVCSRI